MAALPCTFHMRALMKVGRCTAQASGLLVTQNRQAYHALGTDRCTLVCTVAFDHLLSY